MGRILTPDLMREALEFARPAAERILQDQRAIWGPTWVRGYIQFEAEQVYFGFNEKTEWDSSWGPELSFSNIAAAKLSASVRTGLPTRQLVSAAPHLLDQGEYLYIGSVTWEGISVAVSGAKSEADEAIALVVLAAIKMLIFLEARRRMDAGEDRI